MKGTTRYKDWQHMSKMDACCIVHCRYSVASTSSLGRQIYVESNQPSDCNCEHVVLKRIQIQQQQGYSELKDKFCPRCVCKYERRNTTVIKVVVIFVLGVITMLSLYMGFLLCLDPLFKRNRMGAAAAAAYQEQMNEEVTSYLYLGNLGSLSSRRTHSPRLYP